MAYSVVLSSIRLVYPHATRSSSAFATFTGWPSVSTKLRSNLVASVHPNFGLPVPGLRCEYSNLILFIERIDLNEDIEFVEATDVNWPAWRERKSWGLSQVLIRPPCHVWTPALGPFIESDIVQLYG